MNQPLFSSRLSLLSCLVATSIANIALAAPSQNPLFLQEGVAPNLIVTLDDSGSMASAYIPDTFPGGNQTVRFRSSATNPMYYNPDITYTPPRRVTYNATTSELTVTPYPTTFTTAWQNGFRTNQGSINLSNGYRATTSFAGSGTISTSNNPTYDFEVSGVSINSNNNSATRTSPGNIVYTITRTAANACSATASHTSWSSNLTPACTGTNGSFTARLTTNVVPAYYYQLNTAVSGCTAQSTQDACYRLVFVGASEQQNFANWYSFYRTRHLATASAANLAFSSLPENVRVTWQMLNNCTSLTSGSCAGDSGTTDNRLGLFTQTHRQTFFSWLADTPASGGTPLRSAQQRAGNYLATSSTNNRNPYAHTPGSQLNPQYACRPSYHILMTDGLWNGDNNLSVGNIDNTAIASLPGTTRAYSPIAPYRDSSSDTVADLAFLYWSTDARTDLANKVPEYIPYTNANATTQFWDPRNNPANWQNLVTFTMGLGLGSYLTNPAWDGSTFAGTGIAGIIAGTTSWPAITSNTNSTVYDLWHAAINSRGEFFSAESPDQLVNAFRTILNRIADRETSAASVGMESAVSSLDNEAYYARFSSATWTGELIKYDVDSNNQLIKSWNARDLLDSKAPGSRNIKFNNNGSLTNFTWANLPADKQEQLNHKTDGTVDNLGSQRVTFIRGGNPTDTNFRIRKHLLGDIVHSSPVVVTTPDRLPNLMNPLSPQNQTYQAFKTANQNREKRIYVGANDGMLHAFNASGEEVFAFIPTAVFPNLHLLSDPAYSSSHRFFVDGTPVVNDVVIDGQWRTVLIGTLRAGGRGLYALDITDPNNISLLWEFTSTSDQDLGYTFAQPTITRLATGKWAVIIGNGYDSSNKTAALFVLDVKTGDIVRKLVVENTSNANGLSTPRTVDLNGDLITDYVYAGDLRGNLWRFDFMPTVASTPGALPTFTNANSTMTASSIKTSFAGSPLYVAQTATGIQPISTAPNIIRHPGGIGFIVAFGTGKYFESADANANTTHAMSLYGILDRQLNGFSALNTPTLTRSNLQQQTIGSEQTQTFSDTANGTVTNSKTHDIRMISQNSVDWDTKQGWYLDLMANNVRQGEMIATDMTSRANVLFATSIVPNNDPCASGIDRWFFGIDAITGGRTTFNVLDTTGNKTITAADSGTGGVISNIKIPGFGSPAIVGQEAYFNMPNGAETLTTESGPYSRNRQSWRVIGD